MLFDWLYPVCGFAMLCLLLINVPTCQALSHITRSYIHSTLLSANPSD